jgi:hypothetical protein
MGWWLFARQLTGPLGEALALDTGIRQQQMLWTESILLGWGQGTLERLVEVFAQPVEAVIAPWGGPTCLLATGGLVGFAALTALLIYLAARHRERWDRGGDPRRAAAADAAALGALWTGGVVLAGGPRSELVLLMIAGWTALALIKTAPDPPARQAAIPASHRVTGVLLGLLAALAFVLALPTWGSAILRQAPRPGTPAQVHRQRLGLAARLNPFEPAIALAQAAAWRQAMTDSEHWQESLYLRVVGLYRRAERLDPYQPLISLNLAHFQALCDRQEAAVLTVQDALERMPADRELITWLYSFARRQGLSTLAYRMLRHGQQVDPTHPAWWHQCYVRASRLGQGPQARWALAVALTCDPGDPDLVREAWSARQPAAPPPPAPIPEN